MEYLAWIEATAFSTWMRESGLAFFSSLVFHALGMGLLVGVHAVADLRLLGFAPDVPLSRLRRFRSVGTLALATVTVSGVLLLVAYPAKALTNPLFYFKLTAVAGALGVGRALAVGFMSDATRDQGPLPRKARVLALVSLGLWMAVITSGRFLAYTYDVLMASHEM